MMTEATARFRLPFIVPGQAQKELHHNEALTIADALLHAAVEGESLADPPSAPQAGEVWIVGPGPTGAWSGRANALAAWTESGWRFVPPVPGMRAWDKAAGLFVHWTGSEWTTGEVPASKIVIEGEQVVGTRLPAVPSPSGGTIIDAEARTAIEAVIVALRSHGLTE
jgi:hypothetical protein